MAIFAFACNFSPGGTDEKPLLDLVKEVLGGEPSAKEMACMRRLFAESYATVGADIKSHVEASDESAVKKLAPADRAQRLKDQQARLQGLRLRRAYEPGDSLVDKCVASGVEHLRLA